MAKPKKQREKYLYLDAVCDILEMDDKTVRKNIARGLFPRGFSRPGETDKVWTRRDVAVMQYMIEFSHRFQATEGEIPTDGG